MLRIRFITPARRDITEAADYYKTEGGKDLAQDFRLEIRRVVTFAQHFPQGGRVIAQIGGLELRHFLVQRFPYLVIATDIEDELVVFAVASQKRHPNHWKPRLAKVKP